MNFAHGHRIPPIGSARTLRMTFQLKGVGPDNQFDDVVQRTSILPNKDILFSHHAFEWKSFTSIIHGQR